MTMCLRGIVRVALLGAAGLCAGAHAADGSVEPVSVRATAHFDFGRVTMRAQDRDALLSGVGAMKDVTWQSVTAVGHTDSIGSAAANRRLSDRRAEVVKGYLTQKGLDPKMIATRGLGPDEPVADNASADGRAQNRRTEVVFQGVRASAP